MKEFNFKNEWGNDLRIYVNDTVNVRIQRELDKKEASQGTILTKNLTSDQLKELMKIQNEKGDVQAFLSNVCLSNPDLLIAMQEFGQMDDSVLIFVERVGFSPFDEKNNPKCYTQLRDDMDNFIIGLKLDDYEQIKDFVKQVKEDEKKRLEKFQELKKPTN